MVRKIIYVIVMLTLMLIFPAETQAETLPSVIIMPSCGGDGISGGKVTIYYVAEPAEKGFKLTDGLANWFVKDQEAISVDFAKWTVNRRKDIGQTQTVQWNGAAFLNLTPGIYLAEQKIPADGYYAFNSFLFTVTDIDSDIYAYPKITTQQPKTGDRGDVIIGLLGMIIAFVGIFKTIKHYKRKYSV